MNDLRALPFPTNDPQPWLLPASTPARGYRAANPTTDSDDWRFVPRDDDPRGIFDPATTDENGICEECRHRDWHSDNCRTLAQ